MQQYIPAIHAQMHVFNDCSSEYLSNMHISDRSQVSLSVYDRLLNLSLLRLQIHNGAIAASQN